MLLNDDEKRILNGEQGEIAQTCMKFLVDYGEAAGAGNAAPPAPRRTGS